jgi:hypothetical protein
MVGSNLALAQAFNAVAADAAPKRTIDRLSGLKFACHLPRGPLAGKMSGRLHILPFHGTSRRSTQRISRSKA